MNHKALLFGTVLAASLVIVSPAQAHDDYDYPLGLMSGLVLGIYLDGHDRYRDHHEHSYYHREYRRDHSYGYQHRDRYQHHHDRDRRDRGHDHGRYRR
jgi:hypothetical protein